MNGNYLIPSNAKRSMLIFGLFTWYDLVIFGIGIGISLIMLMVVDGTNSLMVLLSIVPGLLGGFLVFPIPNYHNTLTFIISAINYFSGRQKYIWKGWCFDGSDSTK